jgi:hypothetical protein
LTVLTTRKYTITYWKNLNRCKKHTSTTFFGNMLWAPIKETIPTLKKAKIGQFKDVFRKIGSFVRIKFTSQLNNIKKIKTSSVPISTGAAPNLAIGTC